jgi:hypothetical protein
VVLSHHLSGVTEENNKKRIANLGAEMWILNFVNTTQECQPHNRCVRSTLRPKMPFPFTRDFASRLHTNVRESRGTVSDKDDESCWWLDAAVAQQGMCTAVTSAQLNGRITEPHAQQNALATSPFLCNYLKSDKTSGKPVIEENECFILFYNVCLKHVSVH